MSSYHGHSLSPYITSPNINKMKFTTTALLLSSAGLAIAAAILEPVEHMEPMEPASLSLSLASEPAQQMAPEPKPNDRSQNDWEKFWCRISGRGC